MADVQMTSQLVDATQREWYTAFWQLFIYVSVAAAVVGLWLLWRVVRAQNRLNQALLQTLGEQTKSRELAVVMPILNAFVDDPRLSRLRRFVHRHWDSVRSYVSAPNSGVGDVEARWAMAIQRASDDAKASEGDKVTKEDIDELVNSLNHICILLESHQLESLDFAFSDPVVGMWRKLQQFVHDERERRRKDRGSHASFFGVHFESRAKAFQSEEFLQKLRAEADKRGVTWVEKP